MTDTLARMRQLIGTTAEWTANNLVLGDGEIGVERAASGPRIRIGDGATAFLSLPVFTGALGGGARVQLTYAAASAGLPSNVETDIGWNTVSENTLGATYAAPNLTIPSDGGGLYDISLSLQMIAGEAAGTFIQAGLYLFVNGARKRSVGLMHEAGSTSNQMQIACTQRLAAGDVLKTRAFTQSASGSVAFTQSGSLASWFEIVKRS